MKTTSLSKNLPISSITDTIVLPNVITDILESSVFPTSHISDFSIPHSSPNSSIPPVIQVPFTDLASYLSNSHPTPMTDSVDFQIPVNSNFANFSSSTDLPSNSTSANIPILDTEILHSTSLPQLRRSSRIRKSPSYFKN